MMTVEFCPKCFYPLETTISDDGRLCAVCNWFGDKSEVCNKPPTPSDLDLAFAQLLVLFREVCRMELLAEQLVENSANYDKSLKAVRARAAHARHSILHFFHAIRGNSDENLTP